MTQFIVLALAAFGTSMPTQPALPKGFTRWPAGRKASALALKLAQTSLHLLSMGGYRAAVDTDGKTIAAFKEFHLDNHPDKTRLPFWHPGISLLVAA